jgi:hypothetical protein
MQCAAINALRIVAKPAYAPMSVWEFEFLKTEGVVQDRLRDASIYIVAQRPLIWFDNIIIAKNHLSFEITDGGSKRVFCRPDLGEILGLKDGDSLRRHGGVKSPIPRCLCKQWSRRPNCYRSVRSRYQRLHQDCCSARSLYRYGRTTDSSHDRTRCRVRREPPFGDCEGPCRTYPLDAFPPLGLREVHSTESKRDGR